VFESPDVSPPDGEPDDVEPLLVVAPSDSEDADPSPLLPLNEADATDDDGADEGEDDPDGLLLPAEPFECADSEEPGVDDDTTDDEEGEPPALEPLDEWLLSDSLTDDEDFALP